MRHVRDAPVYHHFALMQKFIKKIKIQRTIKMNLLNFEVIIENKISVQTPSLPSEATENYFRFHFPLQYLSSVFGDDWFALKAEAFARFFGTPLFLIGQPSCF